MRHFGGRVSTFQSVNKAPVRSQHWEETCTTRFPGAVEVCPSESVKLNPSRQRERKEIHPSLFSPEPRGVGYEEFQTSFPSSCGKLQCRRMRVWIKRGRCQAHIYVYELHSSSLFHPRLLRKYHCIIRALFDTLSAVCSKLPLPSLFPTSSRVVPPRSKRM